MSLLFFWSAKIHPVLVTQRWFFFFPFIWARVCVCFKYGILVIGFFFFPDPMSVAHVIMLTVVLDGKPYLVEISVLSVSKEMVCHSSVFFCCFGCMVILSTCNFLLLLVTAYH